MSCACNNYRMLLNAKKSLQARDCHYGINDVVSWMIVSML